VVVSQAPERGPSLPERVRAPLRLPRTMTERACNLQHTTKYGLPLTTLFLCDFVQQRVLSAQRFEPEHCMVCLGSSTGIQSIQQMLHSPVKRQI
jgi:hypothetical protein